MLSFSNKWLISAAIILTACQPAFAENDKDKTGGELEGVRQKLEKSSQREKQINKQLGALQREAAEISKRLIELAGKTRSREEKISSGEIRIVQLNATEKQLVARLANRRNALSELLVGLQRLEQDPPPPLAAHRKDALAAIRSATLFAAIIPAIKAETIIIRQDLAELANVRASLSSANKDLKNDFKSLDTVRAELKALLERKKGFVRKTRQQLEQEKQRTAALVVRARDLTQLLARIKQRKIKEEKQKTEAARRAQAARKARELAPKLAFSKARGTLVYPASGKTLRRFHDKTGLGGRFQGELIQTRKNAQVTASIDGIVEFSGKFLTYGQLLILNVGEGYHMLLGGLGKIDVQTGQVVKAGEPLGSMGTTSTRGTLMTASLDVHKPVLYIEFRKKGEPVDPSSWWLSNRRKVSK